MRRCSSGLRAAPAAPGKSGFVLAAIGSSGLFWSDVAAFILLYGFSNKCLDVEEGNPKMKINEASDSKECD